VILEAMSRGIPVMASNAGGLAEAHLGVDYLLPVNPVVRYRPLVDELMVPVAEIPPQDVRPWEAALGRLLTDRAHYQQLSAESRRAALDYARGLNALPFEAYLTKVAGASRRRAAPLSDERRRLLALHRKYLRDADDYWFHVYQPRPGDVIVDIGAGRGEDAFAFSHAVGAAGRVWAIEPHPVSFGILRRFCELNRLANVTALNYACIDRPGEVRIETLPVWESNYVREGVGVQGVRFDDLAAGHGIGRIDFLKMNIEGAERMALPGCREALCRARFVCVAAHDFRADRGEGEEFRTLDFVRRFLAEAGFHIVTRDDPRYYVPYHVHGFR
jgi:FkbM family methyltransferase